MKNGIKQIAKRVGVSPATVSRALNAKGHCSKELSNQILATAKEMNYVPNVVARNLKRSSTNIIGVIVPDISESFFSNVVKGIDSQFARHGYKMFLCNTNEDIKTEKNYVNTLYENRVDGIIIATVRNNIPEDDTIFTGEIPAVFIDNLPSNSSHFDCVTSDNFSAGKNAAEYLIKMGHRDIAAIMGKQTETTGRERFEGFKSALEEHNIPLNERLYKFADFKELSAAQKMNELLKNEKFTALFVASSQMTFGVLRVLKEAGKTAPDDISILGFDIENTYNFMVPSITSVIQQSVIMGSSAASLLYRKIKGSEKFAYNRIMLETQLCTRESVKNLNTKDSL